MFSIEYPGKRFGVLESPEEVLEFFSKQESGHPVHLKHRCIPASSANVERVFSTAGYTASATVHHALIDSFLFRCSMKILVSYK